MSALVAPGQGPLTVTRGPRAPFAERFSARDIKKVN